MPQLISLYKNWFRLYPKKIFAALHLSIGLSPTCHDNYENIRPLMHMTLIKWIIYVYYAVHLDLYDAEPPESWKNLKRHDVSVPNEIGQKGQVLRIKGFFLKLDRSLKTCEQSKSSFVSQEVIAHKYSCISSSVNNWESLDLFYAENGLKRAHCWFHNHTFDWPQWLNQQLKIITEKQATGWDSAIYHFKTILALKR